MIKVGCCGFPTSMERYFKSFSLVELNSTFYHYPHIGTVKGWWERAPKGFEFTVKAHQDISHNARMKVNDVSLQSFERMKQICKALGSKIMLIQTPSSFKLDGLVDAERFFKEVDREDLILVWETRGPSWEKAEAYERLKPMLEEFDVTHVTDPFKAVPAHVGRVAYFRLHGLGERIYYYQYNDEELRRLKELVAPYDEGGKDVYVLFNNLSMFEDCVRFMKYLLTGALPRITSLTGLASIKEVLGKMRFPISKGELVKKVGWRLVELEDGVQVRLGSILADLPSKSFGSLDELIAEAKSVKKLC